MALPDVVTLQSKKRSNMKKVTVIFILLLSMMPSPLNLNVNAAIERINLTMVSVDSDPDPVEIDPGPVKRRSGAKPLPCTITPEGVEIPGVSSNDILLYEVMSEGGECLATFVSEQEFITYINASKETLEIRLHINGFVLSGFLYR